MQVTWKTEKSLQNTSRTQNNSSKLFVSILLSFLFLQISPSIVLSFCLICSSLSLSIFPSVMLMILQLIINALPNVRFLSRAIRAMINELSFLWSTLEFEIRSRLGPYPNSLPTPFLSFLVHDIHGPPCCRVVVESPRFRAECQPLGLRLSGALDPKEAK